MCNSLEERSSPLRSAALHLSTLAENVIRCVLNDAFPRVRLLHNFSIRCRAPEAYRNRFFSNRIINYSTRLGICLVIVISLIPLFPVQLLPFVVSRRNVWSAGRIFDRGKGILSASTISRARHFDRDKKNRRQSFPPFSGERNRA